MSDVLIGKQQSLERCLARVRDAWAQSSTLPFEEDYDKQDIIVLNLQRACEQAIDMANHVVNLKKLGWPRTSGESFDLLARAGVIPAQMAANMKAMVGLRNVVVHQYQDLDLDIIRAVIRNHLDDLSDFARVMVAGTHDEIDPEPFE